MAFFAESGPLNGQHYKGFEATWKESDFTPEGNNTEINLHVTFLHNARLEFFYQLIFTGLYAGCCICFWVGGAGGIEKLKPGYSHPAPPLPSEYKIK